MLSLAFTFPEKGTVCGQTASAAKIVKCTGYQILCPSAARIKMRRKLLPIRIDSHQYTLMLRFSLKDTLLIGEQYRTECPVIQRLGMFLCLTKPLDPFTQLIPTRLMKTGTQRRISLLLAGFCPPLTSVIHAGDSRHSEHQRIDQGKVLLVAQNACHSGHIMVVHEG